jgi:hypothetical protein
MADNDTMSIGGGETRGEFVGDICSCTYPDCPTCSPRHRVCPSCGTGWPTDIAADVLWAKRVLRDLHYQRMDFEAGLSDVVHRLHELVRKFEVATSGLASPETKHGD